MIVRLKLFTVYSLSFPNDIPEEIHGLVETPLGLELIAHNFDIGQFTTIRFSQRFKGSRHTTPGGIELPTDVLPGAILLLLGALEVGQAGVPQNGIIVNHSNELQLVGGIATLHCE